MNHQLRILLKSRVRNQPLAWISSTKLPIRSLLLEWCRHLSTTSKWGNTNTILDVIFGRPSLSASGMEIAANCNNLSMYQSKCVTTMSYRHLIEQTAFLRMKAKQNFRLSVITSIAKGGHYRDKMQHLYSYLPLLRDLNRELKRRKHEKKQNLTQPL